MKAEPIRVKVKAMLVGADDVDIEVVREQLERSLGISFAVEGDRLAGELVMPYRIEVGAGSVHKSAPVMCSACGEPLRSHELFVVQLTPSTDDNLLYHAECSPVDEQS